MMPRVFRQLMHQLVQVEGLLELRLAAMLAKRKASLSRFLVV